MPIVDNFISVEKKFNPLKNRILIYIFCIILMTGFILDVFFANLPLIVTYFNFYNLLLSIVLIVLFFFQRISISNVVRFQIIGLIVNIIVSIFFKSITAPDFASMFVRNTIIIFMLVPFYGLYCGKNQIFQIFLGFLVLYTIILFRSDNEFLINNAPFLIFSAFIYHFAIYYIFDIIEKLQFKQIVLREDLQLQKDNLQLKNIDLEQKNIQIEEQSNELTELLETKDKLFSIIAHDLRSPVAGTQGITEILCQNIKEYNSNEISECLEQINTSSKRTLILLENLLMWTNLQTGKIDFKPEFLDLKILLREIIEVSQSFSKIKNISIQLDLQEDFKVYADRNMIHTVIRNLISNAIKFTNENGEIIISGDRKDLDIQITVSDNGIGMNDKIKNSLFTFNS